MSDFTSKKKKAQVKNFQKVRLHSVHLREEMKRIEELGAGLSGLTIIVIPVGLYSRGGKKPAVLLLCLHASKIIILKLA